MRRKRVKRRSALRRDAKAQSVAASGETTLHTAAEVPFDPNARPIWKIITEIGASVPDEEWAKVPTDAARNLDHYLYGHKKNPA